MKNLINIKRKDNITFGILFFVFFLIIGLYPLKSDGAIRVGERPEEAIDE